MWCILEGIGDKVPCGQNNGVEIESDTPVKKITENILLACQLKETVSGDLY